MSEVHEHEDVETTANRVRIGEITASETSVTVHGTISRVGPRPIGNGEVLTEGIVSDHSGDVRFATRSPLVADRGDRLRVYGAPVHSWRDAPELQLHEAEDVVVRPGQASRSAPVRTLSSLRIGDRAMTVRGRIVESEVARVRSRRGNERVRRGRIADASACLFFTDWTARPGLTPGRNVRIENAYVRPFRDVPSVNLSRYSRIAPVRSPVDVEPFPPAPSIDCILDTDGLADVVVEGTIVELREGSGLVRRCPACWRIITSGRCRRHGAVDATTDLRTKATLDDGTGAVAVILDASITASIYGAGLEGVRTEAQSTMHDDVVADRIANTVVGRPYAVRGRLGVDASGETLVARAVERRDGSPGNRAASVLEGAT